MWHLSGTWFLRPKMSPSRTPSSTRITPMSFFQTPQRSYPSALVSTIILSRWPSKLPVGTSISFICKKDGSLWLDIWDLSDLTIKNRYLLPLIKALPSWSKCQFGQKNIGFPDCRATHLDAQDKPINGLIIARPRLWSSMMGLLVVVVASRTESR